MSSRFATLLQALRSPRRGIAGLVIAVLAGASAFYIWGPATRTEVKPALAEVRQVVPANDQANAKPGADSSSSNAELLLMARTYGAKGEKTKASAAYDQLIAREPSSPLPYVERAKYLVYIGELEGARVDLLDAIRLNPKDIGQDYKPNTDRVLSEAALRHGEQQVKNMLRDRPGMARHVTPGDPLWTWAVRKFAGEDMQALIDWTPSVPVSFDSSSQSGEDGSRGSIFVRDVSGSSKLESISDFECMWSWAVHQLQNVAFTSDSWAVEAAKQGKLDREAFIMAQIEQTQLAMQATRAFYLKQFLPLMRAKNLATSPKHWHCFTFYASEVARNAYFKTLPHWEIYGSYYDRIVEWLYGPQAFPSTQRELKLESPGQLDKTNADSNRPLEPGPESAVFHALTRRPQ
jgi:hypothetical protein